MNSTSSGSIRCRLVGFWAIVGLAALVACSRTIDLTNPHTVAGELRGTWTRPQNFPGSSFTFTIAATNDSLISGVGTYSIEAGASGTLAVSGTLSGTSFQLQFVSDQHLVEHFNGTMPDVNTLTGSFWAEIMQGGNDPIEMTFMRVR